MILTFRTDDKKLDIIVRPEQRIQEVYQRLLENGYFSPTGYGNQITVYSLRQMAYINPLLTFGQGEVFGGDILLIGQQNPLQRGRQS